MFLNHWQRERSKLGPGGKVSIWKVLAKVHAPRFLLSAGIGLVHYLLTFVNPQMLRLVIRHVENDDEETW